MTMNARRWGATLAASTALVIGAPLIVSTNAPQAASAATNAGTTTHKKVRHFTKTVALETALLKSTQRPCRFEDGSGSPLPCHWNAKKQGNGRGVSYTVIYAGKTKKGVTKVIYVYADHDERGTI